MGLSGGSWNLVAMTSPSSPRKRRSHPARRSRRVVGAVSIGATLALAGGMAAAGAHNVAKTSTSVTTTPSSGSSNTGSSSSGSSSGSYWGSSDDNGFDDGSSSWSQFNVPAQSGNASSNPDTSSHAS
jgi:hypothetical protein